MQYSFLGSTGIKVSRMGYGAWALGKKGWPDVDEREALKTLELCLESGINLYDTAPVYGFGRSEELLGQVLSGCRRDVIIATKCGLSWDNRGRVYHDLSDTAIKREIEASLARLKTDYIDIYQIHWPDKKTPLDETLEALCSLKQQGAIRHIGVSNFSISLLETARSQADIVSVQEAYNMLQRGAEADMLPYRKQHSIGFICYSPLAQGLLAGTFDEHFTPARHDIRRLNPLFRNRGAFCRGRHLAAESTGPPAVSALAFLARQPGVSSILVSMTKRRHLIENLTAF